MPSGAQTLELYGHLSLSAHRELSAGAAHFVIASHSSSKTVRLIKNIALSTHFLIGPKAIKLGLLNQAYFVCNSLSIAWRTAYDAFFIINKYVLITS